MTMMQSMTNFGFPLIFAGLACLCIAFGSSVVYVATCPRIIPRWVDRWWIAGFVSFVVGVLIAAWPFVVCLVCYFMDEISGR